MIEQGAPSPAIEQWAPLGGTGWYDALVIDVLRWPGVESWTRQALVDLAHHRPARS